MDGDDRDTGTGDTHDLSVRGQTSVPVKRTECNYPKVNYGERKD